MEDEEIIFEEEEVVWAKIRGYPWWPAFVSDLHEKRGGDIEYTVVFFGDNTNARLDGSKLRKFLQCYIECYNKAKSHRKLMSSIMMAEQKLKQNDQNVQIFEDLRSQAKNKKKSVKAQEDHEEHSQAEPIVQLEGEDSKLKKQHSIYEQSSIIREKSQGKETVRSKSKKSKDRAVIKKQKHVQKNSKIQQELVQDEEQQLGRKKSNGDVAVPSKVKDNWQIQELRERRSRMSSSSIMREVDIVINIHQNKQPENANKIDSQQHIKQSQKVQEEIKEDKTQKKENLIKEVSRQQDVKDTTRDKSHQMQEMEVEKDEESQQEEPSEASGESKNKQIRKRIDNRSSKRNSQTQQSRKRGRPKKSQQVFRQKDESFEEQSKPGKPDLKKKKSIRKQPQPPMRQLQKPKMSLNDQTVINGVQRLLQNREGLIQFLLKASITVDNVKEILDMDVSNILQEGPITERIVHLLQLLRAALLYKYFPDDVKHKKKYERLSKKKNIQIESQKEEENGEKVQLRRKTRMKVKKFLTGIDEPQQKVVDIARKIQQYIFKADSSMSKRYCRIAFLVLSALKDKRQTYQEIIGKLQSKLYD